MTTQSLTVNDALGQLRPYLSDDFLRAWRKVTLALGYRTVGKALAALSPKARPKAEQNEATAAYLEGLDAELVEVETFFQEFPRLTNPPIRTVSRMRKGKGIYTKSGMRTVEQIIVDDTLAGRLKERGIAVEYNKRRGQWWADCEDEAWGRDVSLEELFGQRAGAPGYTFDDVLPMYRKAVEYKAAIPQIKREIALVRKNGA